MMSFWILRFPVRAEIIDFPTGTRVCIPILCNSLCMSQAETCWEVPWLTICVSSSTLVQVGNNADHALGELHLRTTVMSPTEELWFLIPTFENLL
ncbi:hypothetical protein TNCV_2491461 [Trichonephila clavipes]|nr:hypothetical protein TNCV_2491461 [Trichonephila clavipes]